MMPVHYFYRIGVPSSHDRPRRRCNSTVPSSDSNDSDIESETSPKPLCRQRSHSICGYLGLGVEESDTDVNDPYSGPVFGKDLKKVRKSLNVPNVPVLVEDICSIIEEKYIGTEGLYSVFEKKRKLRNIIKMAKFDYDREKLVEMEPSTLAGLLKAFLKGLKTPILGIELAGMIISIGKNVDIPSAKKMKLFAREKRRMSMANQATVYYLIQHFNKVLLHKRENKLTLNVLSGNIATSFFPQFNVKKNPAPMQFLIVYHELIFPS